MDTEIVNVYEAKTHLSKLLERAAQGEEIVIAKAGHPLAKLVKWVPAYAERKPGIWAGQVSISDDFDTFSAQDDLEWYGQE